MKLIAVAALLSLTTPCAALCVDGQDPPETKEQANPKVQELVEEIALLADMMAAAPGRPGWSAGQVVTQDRFGPEQVAIAQEIFLPFMQENDLAGAQRQLETTLASRDSAQGKADLLMAFSLLLHSEVFGSGIDNASLFAAALDAADRSLAHYEEAFGPNHREVALALATRADLRYDANGSKADSNVYADHARALEIRVPLLGNGHVETAMQRLGLANFLMKEDAPEYWQQAREHLEIILASTPPGEPYEMLHHGKLHLMAARMDARLGNPQASIDHLRKAGPSLPNCWEILDAMTPELHRLMDGGKAEVARAITKGVASSDPPICSL